MGNQLSRKFPVFYFAHIYYLCCLSVMPFDKIYIYIIYTIYVQYILDLKFQVRLLRRFLSGIMLHLIFLKVSIHVIKEVELTKDRHLLSTFKINNFYYVINYLNINRVTIYRAKHLGIVVLKVLPTTYFHYNSEEISLKLPIFKMKLNRIDIRLPVQVL